MNTITDAQTILNAFIRDMNKWEVFYYRKIREEGIISVREIMKKELDEIFLKYCTFKDRKQGRQVSLNCSEPPGYSPDDDILSMELFKNKAIFIIQQSEGFKEKYRYTLNFKNKEWRVDKKERFSSYENKWLKDYL